MTAGPISSGRKLATLTLLILAAMLGLNVASSEATGPLSPVNDWSELSPQQTPPAASDGSLAFNEASGEMVYFGGSFSGPESGGTWTWDGSTWTKENPVHSPSPRTEAFMAFDPATGTVLLFGGYDGLQYFDDTWAWDGEDWTELTPTTSPPARSSSSIAFDASTGRMLLFGGSNSGGLFDDTWAWTGTDWTQLAPAHHPPARIGSAMSFDQASGKTMLFGGRAGGGTYLGDTWTWDGTDWTQETPAHTPPARAFATMDFNPALGSTVLFGGGSPGGWTNVTWAWDGEDWTELEPATKPSPRRGPAMSFDPSMGDLVMTGGVTNEGVLSDTWTYGPPPEVTANWSEMSPPHRPPGLSRGSMAFDQANGEMVLFGGNTGSSDSNETWVWDGSDWTQKSPAHSPPARERAVMTFDRSSGEIVLFGGLDADQNRLGDTWVWDGNDWTQKSPASSPPPRFSAAMAFDPASGEVVLFGGADTYRYNQTWTWDGSNWSQESPATIPPRRVGAAMTFDPTDGQIVMFGGQGGANAADNHILDDTWVWDGSDWTQQTPATKPDARQRASMDFDPALGRAILYGGDGYYTSFQDTWAWNGTDWERLTPSASPNARTETNMAFDPSSGSIVLYGGSGNPILDETWVFQLEVGPPTAGITAPADGQSFTVGEAVATEFECEEATGGPGIASCEDSNTGSAPAGTLDTSTLGPHTYTVTATSENGLTGTAQIGYTVEQAEPTVTTSGAVAEAAIGSGLEVDAELTGAHGPTGGLVFRAYGPDDADCSAAPAFESDSVPVSDNGPYSGPTFTPEAVGTYRWVASYSGDPNNQAATSDCGETGSVSTITKTPTPPTPPPPPPPPPPGYKCPQARPGLKLSGFGLKPPFGKAKPVFGIRAALKSRNVIVKLTPSMTYRLAGKSRTVKLKTRTLKVNGRRYLRFRAPGKLKRDFRKAGVSIRRAPVTFKVKAKIRPQGSRAKCFRGLGTRRLKTRLVNVSGRVALRRHGGFRADA